MLTWDADGNHPAAWSIILAGDILIYSIPGWLCTYDVGQKGCSPIYHRIIVIVLFSNWPVAMIGKGVHIHTNSLPDHDVDSPDSSLFPRNVRPLPFDCFFPLEILKKGDKTLPVVGSTATNPSHTPRLGDARASCLLVCLPSRPGQASCRSSMTFQGFRLWFNMIQSIFEWLGNVRSPKKQVGNLKCLNMSWKRHENALRAATRGVDVA